MYFKRIGELRSDRDLKQSQLAAYLNVRQNTYSDYETGKINIPIEALIKLADFYQVSLDYLVGRTDDRRG
ncbi:MAG TPA: helix-turn-helix transcriptional regulator [Candidatus Galloscillospira stercoripullorum]|nr:helix-turn-helix transcriptional regulator [Candidatus Galloscillospira stercoripullorum]